MPLRTMQIRPKESEIQKAILQYLAYRNHFAWRNNTGAMAGQHKGKKWFMRFGLKGSADILGVQRGTGKMIAIEVKVPGGKPTAEQFVFLKGVENLGGIAFVATCVDDVMRAGL